MLDLLRGVLRGVKEGEGRGPAALFTSADAYNGRVFTLRAGKTFPRCRQRADPDDPLLRQLIIMPGHAPIILQRAFHDKHELFRPGTKKEYAAFHGPGAGHRPGMATVLDSGGAGRAGR